MSVPDLAKRGMNCRDGNLRFPALNVRCAGNAALGRDHGGAVPVPALWLVWAAPARLGPRAGSGEAVLAAPPAPAWPHLVPCPRHQPASAAARSLAVLRRPLAGRLDCPRTQGRKRALWTRARLTTPRPTSTFSPRLLCPQLPQLGQAPLHAAWLRPGREAAAPTVSFHSARSPTGAGRAPSRSMGIARGPQAYRDVSANQGRIAPSGNPETTKRRVGS
jgi:hypothetical protein